MTSSPHDAEWRNPLNWRGVFYVAPRDPRLWVPKRPPGIGWTLNFARRASWLVLVLLLGVPLVTALVGVIAGRGR